MPKHVATVLTPEREKFAELVVSGMSTKVAYATLFPTSKPNSARVMGFKWLQRSDVQQAIAKLKSRPLASLRSNLDHRLATLDRCASDERAAWRDRIGAIRLIAEISGDLAPQRIAAIVAQAHPELAQGTKGEIDSALLEAWRLRRQSKEQFQLSASTATVKSDAQPTT